MNTTNIPNLNLRLNRKSKFQLEKDLKDKFSAQNIDEFCGNLRNNSAGIGFKDGAAKIESKYVHVLVMFIKKN